MRSTTDHQSAAGSRPSKMEYDELRDAVDRIRQRHLESPPADNTWVDNAHEIVFATQYAKKLQDIVLRRTFPDLEAGFGRALPTWYAQQDREQMMSSLLCRARQLRFIARYSAIAGYEGVERELPNRGSLASERKRIGGRMRKLARDLQKQWGDEALMESLGMHTARALDNLTKNLPLLADKLQFASPKYAFSHASSLASEKDLVHQLAQLCFRVYEWCDRGMVDRLLTVPWLTLSLSLSTAQINKVIKDTLEGKMRQFQSRVEEAPWDAAREDLAWLPPTSLDHLQPRLD